MGCTIIVFVVNYLEFWYELNFSYLSMRVVAYSEQEGEMPDKPVTSGE